MLRTPFLIDSKGEMHQPNDIFKGVQELNDISERSDVLRERDARRTCPFTPFTAPNKISNPVTPFAAPHIRSEITLGVVTLG